MGEGEQSGCRVWRTLRMEMTLHGFYLWHDNEMASRNDDFFDYIASLPIQTSLLTSITKSDHDFHIIGNDFV